MQYTQTGVEKGKTHTSGDTECTMEKQVRKRVRGAEENDAATKVRDAGKNEIG